MHVLVEVYKLSFGVFRFDSEIQRAKEELNHERTLKDKINREKEKTAADKYKLEHDLAVSAVCREH